METVLTVPEAALRKKLKQLLSGLRPESRHIFFFCSGAAKKENMEKEKKWLTAANSIPGAKPPGIFGHRGGFGLVRFADFRSKSGW